MSKPSSPPGRPLKTGKKILLSLADDCGVDRLSIVGIGASAGGLPA